MFSIWVCTTNVYCWVNIQQIHSQAIRKLSGYPDGRSRHAQWIYDALHGLKVQRKKCVQTCLLNQIIISCIFFHWLLSVEGCVNFSCCKLILLWHILCCELLSERCDLHAGFVFSVEYSEKCISVFSGGKVWRPLSGWHWLSAWKTIPHGLIKKGHLCQEVELKA